MRSPSSSRRPSPAASTVPRCGFSLAVSGSTIPDFVVSSRPSGLTTTRSPSGLSLVAVADAPLVLVAILYGPPGHTAHQPPAVILRRAVHRKTFAARILADALALCKGEC